MVEHDRPTFVQHHLHTRAVKLLWFARSTGHQSRRKDGKVSDALLRKGSPCRDAVCYNSVAETKGEGRQGERESSGTCMTPRTAPRSRSLGAGCHRSAHHSPSSFRTLLRSITYCKSTAPTCQYEVLRGARVVDRVLGGFENAATHHSSSRRWLYLEIREVRRHLPMDDEHRPLEEYRRSHSDDLPRACFGSLVLVCS